MTQNEALAVAKPILFNTDMTRAIQDNLKTATRRVIKGVPNIQGLQPYIIPIYKEPQGLIAQNGRVYHVKTPYKVGDILYVRETWAKVSDWIDVDPEVGIPDGFIYKANWEDETESPKWHPSIHMPKKAARIFLRVTDVRVERLQDMTEEDAFMEGFSGIPWCAHSVFENYPDSPIPCEAAVHSECPPDPPCNHSIPELFGSDIWDKTIKKSDLAKYGWAANPWVLVFEFEKLEVAE